MAKSLKIPNPEHFLLEYRGKNGRKHYTVSSPIEANSKVITVYVFGGGVKSFKVEKIIDMRRIGSSVVEDVPTDRFLDVHPDVEIDEDRPY